MTTTYINQYIIGKHIGNCTLKSHLVILDVFEYVFSRLSQLLFYDIQKSGLLLKIEQLIKEKASSEIISQQQSDLIENLVKIYIKIMKNKEISEEMIQLCLNIVIKCNNNILGSSSLTERQQIVRFKQLYNEIKLLNDDNLNEIFNEWTIAVISERFDNYSDECEISILDVIELSIARNINIQNLALRQESFSKSDNLKNYRLFERINLLLYGKVQEEMNEIKDEKVSEIAEQASCIYLTIMQNDVNNPYITNMCIKILFINICKYLDFILDQIRKSQLEELSENINEQIEQNIKRTTKSMYAISSYKNNNQIQNANQRIKILMYQQFPQLIHLNCDEEINCSLHLSFQTSPSLIQFVESALFGISKYSYNNNEYINFLNEQHNILQHLITFIIYYSINNSFHINFNQQQQQQIDFLPTSSVIVRILDLTIKLLDDNNNCYIALQSEMFKLQLSNLINYKINEQNNLKTKKKKIVNKFEKKVQIVFVYL